MMRNRYTELPVRDLAPATYNPNRLADGQFAQLVDEVRRHGRVLKPVVVRVDGEGRHHIVDGEHNWRAAGAAGLATVPVEVIEADEFEARRQTYKRNLAGTTHKVRLGRMYGEMLAMGTDGMLPVGVSMSGRELAAKLKVDEGTVRNMLLYVKLADMCAGPDDAPGEDAIAMLGVREVRALIAQLEGGDADEDGVVVADTPKAAETEPADLRKLKSAWDKACAPSRAAFWQWAEPPADLLNGEVRNGSAAPVVEPPAPEPAAPEPAPPPAPGAPSAYGITGGELLAMCKAAGITMKSFAEPLGHTATTLSRLVSDAETPVDLDVVKAIKKLQAVAKPEVRRLYATNHRGRALSPPKVVIPELEAMLARGETYASIAAAIGLHPGTPKLWRAGQRSPSPEKLEALRAHARNCEERR